MVHNYLASNLEFEGSKSMYIKNAGKNQKNTYQGLRRNLSISSRPSCQVIESKMVVLGGKMVNLKERALDTHALDDVCITVVRAYDQHTDSPPIHSCTI